MPATNRVEVYPTTGSARSNPPSAPLSDHAYANGVAVITIMSLFTVVMATTYWFASDDWRNVALVAVVYPYSTVVLVLLIDHWDKRQQRDKSSSEEPWAGGCLRVSPEVRLVVVAGIMFSLAFTLAGYVLRPDWFDWAVIVIWPVVHTATLSSGVYRAMGKAFERERRQQALELV